MSYPYCLIKKGSSLFLVDMIFLAGCYKEVFASIPSNAIKFAAPENTAKAQA